MARQKTINAFFIWGVVGMTMSSLLTLANPAAKKTPSLKPIITDALVHADLGFRCNPFIVKPATEKGYVKT